MSKLIYTLSAKAEPINGKREILARFYHGQINQRAKTNIFVSPEYWNQDKQLLQAPAFRSMSSEQRETINQLARDNKRLSELSAKIQQSFIDDGAGKQPLPKDWLKTIVTASSIGEQPQLNRPTFAELFDKYLNLTEISTHRKNQYKVVARSCQRFLIYSELESYAESITPEGIHDFSIFLEDEHTLITRDKDNTRLFASSKYEAAFNAAPESRDPQPRGQNAIIDQLTKLRSFYKWAHENRYIEADPFTKYKIGAAIYGTPYYITIAERNQLYNADLSKRPALAIQRDIFVFQCLIGCRVSDLKRLTKSSINNGILEYIPIKTKEMRGAAVRVPLNDTALEILKRYQDTPGEKLLPFISDQKYNESIKEAFKLSGLNRIVTILNPTTREEERRQLYEIASSHLARRTFVGNLYKQVQDPNLIGKLTGHAEGSKAFARYRQIDDEISLQLVKMLE